MIRKLLMVAAVTIVPVGAVLAPAPLPGPALTRSPGQAQLSAAEQLVQQLIHLLFVPKEHGQCSEVPSVRYPSIKQ